MNTILVDGKIDDAALRQHIYDGSLVILAPRPASRELGDFARAMIREAFGSDDPLVAQHHMTVEEYVSTVAPLKPRFTHHPRCKELLRDLIVDAGCEIGETYLDVPRLRMVTSDAYLTSGV